MVAAFCLRLSWGLIASMLVLPLAQVHPRFFRVQYLTALGLLAATGFFLLAGWFHVWTLGIALSMVCCFAGSVVWHVEGAPLARAILYLTFLSLTWLLFVVSRESTNVADAVSSAALLGTCTSAMLMGHSYLVAPAMSLTPLMRLLTGIGTAFVVRVTLASISLIVLINRYGSDGLDIFDAVLLTTRWLIGFFGVLALTWMAWESARLRSTQSATGILYVVVVFCFIGELTSQVLAAKKGWYTL